MRAVCVVPARKEVAVIDLPSPALATPTAVRLRMLDVGVCGTDKEICAFDYGQPPAGSDRLVIGHEALGEVVEVGAAVSALKPGDLVVPMVRRPCPHPACVACVSGRADFCSTGDFSERGIKAADGFMTEQVVEDERWLVPVPRALRDVGVLVEPLTIAMKALDEIWQVQSRLPWGCPIRADGSGDRAYCHRALVLGGGPVGLLGAMALVANGFQTTVFSREGDDSDKAQLVRAIGARYLSGAAMTVADAMRAAGPVDVVYEAAGASALAFDALQELGPNGIFVFTGVPGRKAPISVDTDRLMRAMVLNNQIVLGSVNAGRSCYEAAAAALGDWMRRWPDQVRALITARVSMDVAVRLLKTGAGGIKNVVDVAAR